MTETRDFNPILIFAIHGVVFWLFRAADLATAVYGCILIFEDHGFSLLMVTNYDLF